MSCRWCGVPDGAPHDPACWVSPTGIAAVLLDAPARVSPAELERRVLAAAAIPCPVCGHPIPDHLDGVCLVCGRA